MTEDLKVSSEVIVSIFKPKEKDLPILKRSYDAIQQIKALVEKTIKIGKENKIDSFDFVTSGFNSWPTPSPYYITCNGEIYFETMYYAKDRTMVYVLRKDQSDLPSYVGSVLIPRTRWLSAVPKGVEAYLIYDDATFEKINIETP